MAKSKFWIYVFFIPLFVAFTASAESEAVIGDVPVSEIENDLSDYEERYLKRLVNNESERRKYIARLYYEMALEKRIESEKLLGDPEILARVRMLRNELYLKALVRKELEQSEEAVLEVAKERYAVNKDKYKTKKRIQIAIIRLRKDAEDAREKLEKLVLEIKKSESPVELFSDFAKSYSVDENAKNGGKIKKWIIVPSADERSGEKNPVVDAAYSIENVGELSDIIEMKNSLNLIMLLVMDPSKQLSFSKVKKDIIDDITADIWGDKMAEVNSSLTLKDEVNLDDELLLEVISKKLNKKK